MPTDLDALPANLPPEHRPIRRRYTVRNWDPERRLLSIDFVVHGDVGTAGAWANSAQPGDVLQLTLPGGAYRPDPDADWHLMVGDESALPAIAASLEALPDGVPAVVRLVCDGPDDELELDTPGALDIVWSHRTGNPQDADLLGEAVRDLHTPPGRVHAFVHGEAGEVRTVRRHLLADRGIPKAALSASGYWRRHLTDEAWREVKADFNAVMEADV